MSMDISIHIKEKGITYKIFNIVDDQGVEKKYLIVHTHHYAM